MEDFKDLLSSIENGELEKVKEYLENYPDAINMRDDGDEGESPLHTAAMNGHPDIVKLLIESGAEVNSLANFGRTPLHWAAWNGFSDVTKLLIENGAIVNAKVTGMSTVSVASGGPPTSEVGSTALHYASYEGHEEVCKILIENGADVNIKTNEGWTPLHRAKFGDHENIVKLIEEHGGTE